MSIVVGGDNERTIACHLARQVYKHPTDSQISDSQDPYNSELTHTRIPNNFVSGVVIGIVESSARKEDEVYVVT